MKIVTNIIIVISILLTIYYLYLHLIPFEIGKVGLGIMSIIFLILPIFVEKICKIKVEKYIKLIYYFFLLVSFILGGLFQLYYSTLYFDLFVHGIFGLLLSIIVGTKVKPNSFTNSFLIISVVVFISFLWETLEFFGDVFFNTDHQRRISGATDTMTDLLITMVGSNIYLLYYMIMNKIKK